MQLLNARMKYCYWQPFRTGKIKDHKWSVALVQAGFESNAYLEHAIFPRCPNCFATHLYPQLLLCLFISVVSVSLMLALVCVFVWVHCCCCCYCCCLCPGLSAFACRRVGRSQSRAIASKILFLQMQIFFVKIFRKLQIWESFHIISCINFFNLVAAINTVVLQVTVS